LSVPLAMIGRVNHYTFRAEWSPGEGQYVGVCLEFPSRYSRAPTARAAIEAIEREIADAVAEMVEFGDALPAPLTDRTYSGNFVVRTSPALHARLMVEAAEQRVSLNQWVIQKLAGRPSRPSIEDLFQ
jgi:predicted HicB family RNase H-like nuclease